MFQTGWFYHQLALYSLFGSRRAVITNESPAIPVPDQVMFSLVVTHGTIALQFCCPAEKKEVGKCGKDMATCNESGRM